MPFKLMHLQTWIFRFASPFAIFAEHVISLHRCWAVCGPRWAVTVMICSATYHWPRQCRQSLWQSPMTPRCIQQMAWARRQRKPKMPPRRCSLLKSGWARERRVARTTRVQVQALALHLALWSVPASLEVMVHPRLGGTLLWRYNLPCCSLVSNRLLIFCRCWQATAPKRVPQPPGTGHWDAPK